MPVYFSLQLKLCFPLLLFGTLVHICHAQAASDSFQEHDVLRVAFRTNTSNEGVAVLTDGRGNVYVVGHTTPTSRVNVATIAAVSPENSFTQDWERVGYGGQDVFIAKIKATGDLAYVRTIGSPHDDFVTSATIDSEGQSIFLTGSSGGVVSNASIASPETSVRGASSPYTGRFDTHTGNQTWLVSIGSPASDDSNAIALSTDECHVYTGGSVGGSLFSPIAAGRKQSLVIKFDADSGEVTWAMQREVGSASSSVQALHVIAESTDSGASHDLVRVAVSVNNEEVGDTSQAARLQDVALLVLDGRDGQVLLEHVDKLLADTEPVSLTADPTTGRRVAFVASTYFSDKVAGYEFSCARFDFNTSSESSEGTSSASWEVVKSWETRLSSSPPHGRIIGVPDLTTGAVMSPSGAEIVLFGSSPGVMSDSKVLLPSDVEPEGIGTTTVVLKFLAESGIVTYTAQSHHVGEGFWDRAKGGALAYQGSAAAKAWMPDRGQDVLLLTGSARSNMSGAGTDVLLFAVGVPPTAADVLQEDADTVYESQNPELSPDSADQGLALSFKLGVGVTVGVGCTLVILGILITTIRYASAAALANASRSSSFRDIDGLEELPHSAVLETLVASQERAGASALC